MLRRTTSAAEAIEETILNALFVAGTMTARDDHTWSGLPLELVLPMLCRHGKCA